jgi:prolyl oligopeptidase
LALLFQILLGYGLKTRWLSIFVAGISILGEGLSIGADAAIESPPMARVEIVTDTYFGVPVDDPYRYLENIQAPEVAAWMKTQSDHTESVLKSIPGRAALVARVQELEDGVAARVTGVSWLPNGRVFYLKRAPEDNQAKLYVRETMIADEQLLVDPEVIARQSGRTVSIHFYAPSPTGRYVAYGLSESGTEQVYMSVMLTATKMVMGDPIDRTSANVVGTTLKWLPDETGFFFNRKQELKPGMPLTDKYLNSSAYFFRISAARADSQPIFGNGNPNAPRLDPEEFPFVVIPKNSKYMLALSYHGILNEFSLYVALRSQLDASGISWKSIVTLADKIIGFAVYRDTLYLVTGRDAPRHKVIRTTLTNPHLDRAEVVLPQSRAVISDIAAAADGVYVKLVDGGRGRLVRIAHGSAKIEPIRLPTDGSVRIIYTDTARPGALLQLAGWTRAPQFYYYEPEAKAQRLSIQPLGTFDAPQGLVSKEVTVRSYDGVMVPLSVVHQRGLTLDGNNPTLLTGYGAYGYLQEPFYDARWLSWFEHGGVYAIAHVRGGGEYGEEWHLAGQKNTKPNSWKDLVACAEYLVDQKYTSELRLGIQGASAGGLLVARAFTYRPDLFAAVVPAVGVSDAIRMEGTPGGSANTAEFGSSKSEPGFRGLLEMSAYYQVRDGVKYPGVLLPHGVNDPRVPVWESTKMAARLRAASGSDKPVLLRLDYDAGHGIGSSKLQRRSEFVDTLTFMLWQFGEPEFKPTLH